MYKVLISHAYKSYYDSYDCDYHAVRFDTEEHAYGFALGALHYVKVVHEEMYDIAGGIYMLDVNTDKIYLATNYKRKAFGDYRSVLSFEWEEADESPEIEEWLRQWFTSFK